MSKNYSLTPQRRKKPQSRKKNYQENFAFLWKFCGFAVLMSNICVLLFSQTAFAAIASSKNYKLHTGSADGGGGIGSSTTYTADNSVGAPLNTVSALSSKYKIYGGLLNTVNLLPTVAVASFNDGGISVDNTPELKWNYQDKDADIQRYYQVQISKDNFKTSVVDTGLVSSKNDSFTTPQLSETEAGVVYRWRVRVSDGYDLSGWSTASFGFRLRPLAAQVPVIWAKTYIGGEEISPKMWQRDNDPYLYWEVPVVGLEIAGYSYSWDTPPDDTADTIATSYESPAGFLSDGIHTFYLKAQNTSGLWGDVANFEVWVDRTPPSIGGFSPTNGSTLAFDRPTIQISVTDEKSGVDPAGISLRINKAEVSAAYDDASKQVIYVPTIPLSEGDIVVSLEVKDLVGNRSSQLVWGFVVDTKAPTGYIIINNQDPITNSMYVTLTFKAEDATTGVSSIIISNDGVFDTEAWESYKTRYENWQIPAISGTRKVYVKFKDSAGNESEIFSDTIELVIIAPDTIITSGPSEFTTSREALFTFRSTLEDSLFRWKFDQDTEWFEWTNKNSIYKSDLIEGNHYFKVQAAKDLNKNGSIDPDEIDPTPAERTWTITSEGALKPKLPPKKPFRYWKEE